jgi:hypothetical protein
MSYTPTKGSPRPSVPGANLVEVVLSAAENLAAKIPVGSPLLGDVQLVLQAAEAAVAAVDPSGMKAGQRTALLTTAEAETHSSDPNVVQQGITDATEFAQDIPAHPVPWVRWARWICVQIGGTDPLPLGP